MDNLIRRTSQRFLTFSSVLTVALVGFLGTATAKVTPNALFTDHAVLQQGIAIPVWGAADPGEAVKVTLGGESRETTANEAGRWLVYLDSRETGGPHSLTIKGTNKIELSDVLIGEVWVCSGQSNMAWSVRRSDKPDTEIAAANWPNIRLYTVKRKVSGEPLLNVDGSGWTATTPESIRNFSVVA